MVHHHEEGDAVGDGDDKGDGDAEDAVSNFENRDNAMTMLQR